MKEWKSNLPDDAPEPPITLILACDKSRIDEDKVEIVDISEDERGWDVIRFKCPKCGFLHVSNRYG